MVLSQYFLLTACSSLALISLHVSAGSSEIEPRGATMKRWHNKFIYYVNLLCNFFFFCSNFVSRESQCSLRETLRSEGNKSNCFPRGQGVICYALLYSWKFWSWKFINPRCNRSRQRSAWAGNSPLLPSEVIDFATLPLRDFGGKQFHC